MLALPCLPCLASGTLLSPLVASVAYTVYYFSDGVLTANEKVDYAEAALTLATAVNDWSAAHAAERTVAVLALQQAVSSCPGATRSVLPPLIWSAAMTTARLTASKALPAACVAQSPPSLGYAAANCTNIAAAAMMQAASAMITDDAQKVTLQQFVGELQGSALAIRSVFSGAASGGASFSCPRPADYARLNSLVANMVQQANHVLTVISGVGNTDQVQDAGLCLQAAYYVEQAGVEVLKTLLIAETAAAAAAASGGNLTLAAAATVDDIAMLPFLLAASRLADVASLIRSTHTFVGQPMQLQLRSFALAAQAASFTLMETSGNTSAVLLSMNTTSTAWAARMAAVATSLARFSNDLMTEHTTDAAWARETALMMISTPAVEALALLMLLYAAWLLVTRHLNNRALSLKEAQLQSKNAFVSYV